MEKMLLALVLIACSATVCIAAESHNDKETKEDVCNQELLAACKGLAFGKFSGMKHAH